MNILSKQSYDNFEVKKSRYAEKEEIKSKTFECSIYDHKRSFSGPTILGDKDKFYIDPSQNHGIVFGASNSKKTRLEAFQLVYSTIDAGHSAVISDVKEEIYERTSGYAKANGYNVFTLNLRNPKKSNCWNLFSDIIYFYNKGEKDLAYQILSDIMFILFKSKVSNNDPYWDDTAADFAVAIGKLLLEAESNVKNINFKNFLKLRFEGIKGHESGELYELYKKIPANSELHNNLSAVLALPDRTMACVMSTFDAKISPFKMRPDIVDILSQDEIEIEKLVNEKTLIYIITPDESRTFNSVISMFIKSVYTRLVQIAQQSPNFTLSRRVNFILDEFANMPTIKDFDNVLTCARSRNLRFFLFVQSMEQLMKYYPESYSTIIGNCSTIIYLYSREQALLRYLSEMCGDEYGKPLISTSELQRLNKEKGEALVLYEREYPFITNLLDIDDYHYPSFEPVVKKATSRKQRDSKINWKRYYSNIMKAYNNEQLDEWSEKVNINELLA